MGHSSTCTQNLNEKLITSEQMFQGSFINLFRDTVELPNGKLTTREYIRHNGAVAILALDQHNNIIMERQYRHAVAKVIYEIPAGKLEPHEDELTCARRELIEESGYVATNWQFLGEALPCIGYSNERIVYYLATGLSFIGQNLDEGEFLEIILQPLEEVFNQAFRGQLADGKTITGLMLLYGHLQAII